MRLARRKIEQRGETRGREVRFPLDGQRRGRLGRRERRSAFYCDIGRIYYDIYCDIVRHFRAAAAPVMEKVRRAVGL